MDLKPIERAYQKAALLKIPLNVHFDLTYRCNQHCLHCYLPETWRQGGGPGPDLDTVQVKSVLDQLAAAGTFFLTFSGGEIFLRMDLMDLVQYARRLDFAVALKTNGALGPSNEQIKILAELGVDSIQVSLYSLEPTLHDRVTGMSGSLVRLLKVVEKCRAQGLQVTLNSMVFSFTFRQIADIKKYAVQEDIYMRMDGTLIPRWDGKSHPSGLAIGSEGKREINSLMGIKEQHRRESCTVPLFPALSMDGEGCAAATTVCYLTPQGYLWPCIDIPYNCGKVGRKGSFLKLWYDSQKLNSIRAMQGRVPEEDRLCDYFRRTMSTNVAEQFY